MPSYYTPSKRRINFSQFIRPYQEGMNLLVERSLILRNVTLCSGVSLARQFGGT